MIARGIALMLALCFARSASADWEVRRSAFDPAVVRQYQRALEQNPDDPRALERLRALYRAHRSLFALEAEYVARAEESHALADRLVAAHLARARGNLPTAAQRYENIAADFPTDTRPRGALAEIRLKQGRPRDALTLYRSLLAETREGPARRALLRRLANLVVAPETQVAGKDSVAEARGYLEELLRLSPGDLEIKRELAEFLAAHSQEKEALIHFRALADKESRDPQRRAATELRIGALSETVGDDVGAREAFRRSLALVPSNHPLRREVLDRWLELERRRDELRALRERWEREWPNAHRGFAQWEVLGRLYDELGDGPAAEAAYRRAISAEPHALDTRKRLVAALNRNGRDADALAEMRRLVAAAPGDPRLKLELISRLHKSGEPEQNKEARTLAARLAKETRDPGVHGALAELYARWGMAKEALSERELLVRLDPDDEAHLIDLGELYFQRNEKARAIETWRRIAKGNQEAQIIRLAEVLDEHNLHDEARPLYARALALAPKSLLVRRSYAASLERAHRDREAIAIWEQLFDELASTPAGVGDLRSRIGTLVARVGNASSEATRYAARGNAVKDSKAGLAYILLASELWEREGSFMKAERAIDDALKRLTAPELKADAFAARARLYVARKDIGGAIRCLKEAAALAPSRQRELYAQIAEWSLTLYRDADAVSYAEQAAALAPGDAAQQERLAEIYAKKGALDDAARAYERAIVLDGRKWQMRLSLARIQLRRGNFARASTLYREVLARVTDEEALLEAARRAIDIDELLGTLEGLERVLAPLAFAAPDRKIYGELLLDLYDRMLPALDRTARSSSEDASRLARAGQRALRPLLDLLVDANPAAQRRAIRLLELGGHPAAAPPLIKLALTVRDPKEIDLRVNAALAASSIADARSFEGLRSLLAQKEKHLRLAAVVGLERLGDGRSSALVTRALGDIDGDVQAAACLVLGRRRVESSAPELSRILRDRTRSGAARAAAAWALGGLPHGAYVDALIASVSEASDDVARASAWALSGDAKAVPVLLKVVFTQRAHLRAEAARALQSGAATLEKLTWRRSTDGVDVAATLASLTASDNGAVTRPFDLTSNLEPAVHALSDALSRHREIIVRTLDDLVASDGSLAYGPIAISDGSRGDLALITERLCPILDTLLTHPSPAVRARATNLRVRLSDGRAWALARLIKASLDERLWLYEALRRAPPSAEALTADFGGVVRTAILSVDAEERRAGAQLAARLAKRDPGVIEALLLHRADADGFVRDAVRTALTAK